MIHQRHRRTDRRSDDMRSQDRSLHCSASRGKKQAASSTRAGDAAQKDVDCDSNLRGGATWSARDGGGGGWFGGGPTWCGPDETGGGGGGVRKSAAEPWWTAVK